MDYSAESVRSGLKSLDLAVRNVEKAIAQDVSAPTIAEVMNVSAQTGPTVSGLTDNDYPNINSPSLALNKVCQVKTLSKVPLPLEIMERFSHIHCHSMMGLFTEINRAWLTVDSDIYVWTYEEGGDVAYYDGVNETVLCVGLIQPKPGIFHNFIKHLLVVCTALDIVVLGVTFSKNVTNGCEEIQLVPEPVFTIPTDGSTITTVQGTNSGRLFLGSKDGLLFEISYQAQSNWFGKRCKKINHSTSTLSFLVPSFLNAALNEEDGIVQMSVDDSRNILYTLTEKASIHVYDLGEKGDSFSKVTTLTQSALVQQAMIAVKKSLDSQNFRPVVSISAVEASESGLINLVAVTQSGVRFYLSCTGLSNLQPNQRPYTLTVLHVRLPPGYSAIVTVRPRNVHMANYREANLMLLSTVNDKDILWCLNSDLFLFSSVFVESYATLELDGPAWALAEERQQNLPTKQPLRPIPPLAVRQHCEAPKKYVALTAQGAHIFLKLRPVDILRQLLVDCRGPDNDTVRTFFLMQKEEQACVTALILACLESTENAEIAEWSTRAFFIYGGEPRMIVNPQFNQTSPFSDSTVFSPNIISTPMHGQLQMRPAQMSPVDHQSFTSFAPVGFSAKCNSLYLYLSRILRPLWNNSCVEKIESKNQTYLVSAISSEECTCILSYLNGLHGFLLKNASLSMPGTINDQTQTSFNVTKLDQTVQDAQVGERQLLECFKKFVDHCCQVVSLWKILCDHQFHQLAAMLPENYQQMLPNTVFKEIFLYGQELCGAFINCLINNYLADNASVDSISSKLREVCPELYRIEDATCSKAHEVLQLSKTIQNLEEKEEHLLAALNLCKSVAPQINLHEVCQQFASLEAYHAVIELCVTCAKKIDPDNIAEFYFKNGNEHQDSCSFYTNKMSIYKEILLILDSLHSQTVTFSPSGMQNGHVAPDKHSLILKIIDEILKYEDILLHVAVYEWMVAKQMESDLIKISHQSLEDYLMHAIKQNPDNITNLDLLWKHYECNNNHGAAAKILHNLASKPGNMLTLKQRIEYLARGIMCMRSDKVGYAPNLGVFLKDLEDKLDTARVQDLILQAISNLSENEANVTEAIAALNSGLYDLTQLYEEFADPFNLWECKLAIIDCAEYSDEHLIKSIWKNIINEEIDKSRGSKDDRMVQLLSKVAALLNRYKSPNTVPIEFIIEKLEMISVKLKADPTLVASTLYSHVPMDVIVQNYDRLISKANADLFWSLEENEFHLCKSFVSLVQKFLSTRQDYDHNIRLKIKAICEDSIANLLSRLYRKPNTEDLITLLREVQATLSTASIFYHKV